MRTILSSVVRRKFTVLAVVAAITVATASAALAGTGVGGVFNLGVTNTVNAITTLKGVVGGPSLRIDNDSTGTGVTALQLLVEPGKPPMKVNSGVKVINLNADKVDGKNAADFLPASGKAVDSDKLDGLDSSQFLGANQKAVDSDKLDGLDSAQLAVKTGFAAGFGANPSATTQFLAPPAVVTVGAGQAVQVTSNKAFGSTLSGGADSLDLFICHRPEGSTATPTTFGPGIFNNRVAEDTRVTMGISAVISGLPAGSHQVGMCGDADTNANWNNNEFGYTSALVVTPPSGGAAASSTTQIQER